jgi:parallel beta-helix repeat protein
MLIRIISVLLSLSFASIVRAETYWASPSGGAANCAAASGQSDPGQYRTVSQGISCLSSGDTLRLIAGDYSWINADSIPNGAPEAYTKIIGAGMSGGTKILIPSNENGINFLTLKQYLEFSDLELDGQNGTGHNAINIDSASQHLRFIRVWGHSTSNMGFLAGRAASDIEMFDVEFSHAGVNGSCNYFPGEGYCHGLYFSASNVVIDGCSVHDNDGLGFQIYEQPQHNVIVQNCKIYNNLGWGLLTSVNATNIRIHNNTIYKNGVGILLQGGATNIATNNLVFANNWADIVCNNGTCSDNLTTETLCRCGQPSNLLKRE